MTGASISCVYGGNDPVNNSDPSGLNYEYHRTGTLYTRHHYNQETKEWEDTSWPEWDGMLCWETDGRVSRVGAPLNDDGGNVIPDDCSKKIAAAAFSVGFDMVTANIAGRVKAAKRLRDGYHQSHLRNFFLGTRGLTRLYAEATMDRAARDAVTTGSVAPAMARLVPARTTGYALTAAGLTEDLYLGAAAIDIFNPAPISAGSVVAIADAIMSCVSK